MSFPNWNLSKAIVFEKFGFTLTLQRILLYVFGVGGVRNLILRLSESFYCLLILKKKDIQEVNMHHEEDGIYAFCHRQHDILIFHLSDFSFFFFNPKTFIYINNRCFFFLFLQTGSYLHVFVV